MSKNSTQVVLEEGVDYKAILGDKDERWAIICRGLDAVNPVIGSYDTYSDAEKVWKAFEAGIFTIVGSTRDFYYLTQKNGPSRIAHWKEVQEQEIEL